MRILLLSILLAFSAITSAHAFSSLPAQECDTILTKKGKRIVARIISADKDRIRYQYCADSSDAPIRFISRQNVKTVLKAKPLVPMVDTPPRAVTKDNGDLPPSPSDGDKDDLAPIEVLPEQLSPEDAAKYRKKAQKTVKKAALFSFGSAFLLLFAYAFSPWLLILTIPFCIAGIIYAARGLRMTKRRPDLMKERRLAGFSLLVSLVYGSIIAAYLLIAFIGLLFLILFGF